jgi:hypothetical protein
MDAFLAQDVTANVALNFQGTYRLNLEDARLQLGEVEVLRGIDLTFLGGLELDWQLDGQNTTVSKGTLDIGLKTRLLYTDLDIGFWLGGSDRGLLTRGRHSIILPSKEIGPVHLLERYSYGQDSSGQSALVHGVGVILQIPDTMYAKGDVELQQNNFNLQKNWTVNLKSTNIPGFNAALLLKVQENATSTTSLSPFYFEAWSNTWPTLFMFDEGQKTFRFSQGIITLEGLAAPLDLRGEIQSGIQVGNFGAFDTRYTNAYTILIGLGSKETSWYMALGANYQGVLDDNQGLHKPLDSEISSWGSAMLLWPD